MRRPGRPLRGVLPAGDPRWEVVAASLRGVPFLAPLPAAELGTVAAGLELVEFREGEPIVRGPGRLIGRLSALSVFLYMKIHFVWGFCMGAKGA